MVGDFNGDGRPDLATANLDSGDIAVLLGNGDGSFQDPRRFGAGAYPASLVAGDFNGDHQVDLATANLGSGDIAVLLGNGDGSFQDPRRFGAGAYPASLVAGDFNSDGRPDLATADAGSDDVAVLLGNGDGSFQDPRRFGAGAYPASLVAGDFNGDGRPDLATANLGSGDIAVLLGNGDGSFQDPRRLGAETHPWSLVTGDFNGDKKLDLATVNLGSGDIAVLLGNGDGSFQDPRWLGAETHPWSLVTGDFNGDHQVDLATVNLGSGDIAVLLGNGDGSFQDPRQFGAGAYPASLVAGDFNGDGRPDLATANLGSGDIAVLLGNGDGSFQDPRQFGAETYPWSLVTGDFNGDKKLDLATVNLGSGDIAVLLGNGDGSFQDPRRFGAGISPASLVAGDFNGDGRPDLATANFYSGTIIVLLGNGDGSFQDPRQFGAGAYPASLVAGDFNGDGRPDLATANLGSGDIAVLLGNGDGSFQDPRRLGAGAYPASLVTGDFNSDGRPDLATANFYSGTIIVLLGNGDGSFQDLLRLGAGAYPASLVAGDFNGDGRPDLATANLGSDDIAVLLGNGDGSFQDPRQFGAGISPASLVAGDFNGDGRPDLATANLGSGDIAVLLGNGDGSFQDPRQFGAGISPASLVAGDFNGDHQVDLATANLGSGDIAVLLGNGDGSFQDPRQFGAGISPASLVAGDFNGDHQVDLATANLGSGDIAVLLGNGDGSFQDPRRFGAGSPAGRATSLVAGDFNGDGRPDLATAHVWSDDITAMLGGGDGQFVAPSLFATAPHATPLPADFNGDITTDVVVTDAAGDILYRQGQPRKPSSFDPPVKINPGSPARDVAYLTTRLGPTLAAVDARDDAVSLYVFRAGGYARVGSLPTGRLPAQIEAADLDGDGWDDLVVRNAGDGTLSVFFNTGRDSHRSPTATSLPPLILPVGLGLSDVAPVDIRGDGTIDLVVTNLLSGELSILHNRGDRTFAPPMPYRAGTGLARLDVPDGPTAITGLESPAITSLESTSGVAAGQFTPGHPTDLVTVNPGSNTFDVLAGLGAGRFANPVTFQTKNPAQVVRVADFNHDGIPDLALLGSKGLSILLGDGKGGFAPPTSYDAGPDPTGLTVADVDNDGKLDLLVGNPFGDVLVLRGKGDGTFQPYRKTDQSVALAVADFGNGTKGLIYANQGLDRVVVDYGGQKTVVGDRSQGLLAPGAVKVADLDGDKIPDLIVANSGSNNVLVYPGLGNGQFGPALNGGHGFFAGTNPVGISVADVNGDGRPDLVVANKGSNDVSILLNQPQGNSLTFTPGPRLKAGSGPVSTVVQDVTGDGIPDVLVSNSQSNNVMLLPGVGGGFFNDQNPRVFPVGNGPGPLFVGNFDGSPGLLTVNSGSNDLTLISDFMGSHPVTTPISSGGLDPVAAVEFSSGSGFDNLVVANNGDGTFALLEGGPDGLNRTSTETEPGLNPTDLAFLAFTGGLVQFYAATEGSETATLLTFQLGGETGTPASPTVPLLQPLRDAALPLIATLLILTLETPTAEFDPGAFDGGASAALAFLPETSITAGQSLLEPADLGEGGGDGQQEPDTPEEPIPPVSQEPLPWQPFSMGLEKALDQFCRDHLDQFLSPDKPATGTQVLRMLWRNRRI